MHARLASLLLIASAVMLSFILFIAGEVVIPVFRTAYQGLPPMLVREFLPAPTLFVSDHRSFVVVLLAGVCLLSLVAIWILPSQTFRCIAVGLCAQWLVGWTAAFCLFYTGFLGSVSMHHDQRFEFDQFFSLAGGVFPLSFALIVAPLVVALWPIITLRRTRPA